MGYDDAHMGVCRQKHGAYFRHGMAESIYVRNLSRVYRKVAGNLPSGLK